MCSTDRRPCPSRELVLREGAHHALDHKAPDYLDTLAALTDGKGPDVILEMASHLNLAQDLTAVAKFGRVVVIGCRGPIEINPRDTMSRDASILGMQLANATEAESASIWSALEAGFANGTLATGRADAALRNEGRWRVCAPLSR